MRVVRHYAANDALDHSAIEYERWGIDARGLPVDDGNVRAGHYLHLVPALMPGVWRYPPATPDTEVWADGHRYAVPSHHRWPTYYRLIDCNADGQMEMIL